MANTDDAVKMFEHKLSLILVDFYERLEKIAYDK